MLRGGSLGRWEVALSCRSKQSESQRGGGLDMLFDPNTMPKRSRWGPRHHSAAAVHQNDQQRNQSFALKR